MATSTDDKYLTVHVFSGLICEVDDNIKVSEGQSCIPLPACHAFLRASLPCPSRQPLAKYLGRESAEIVTRRSSQKCVMKTVFFTRKQLLQELLHRYLVACAFASRLFCHCCASFAQYGMIEAISHLIHRDYEAIVVDFVTLGFIP
eukprot:scaffold261298_cov19-Tisochrysis_lutea.AAC.1